MEVACESKPSMTEGLLPGKSVTAEQRRFTFMPDNPSVTRRARDSSLYTREPRARTILRVSLSIQLPYRNNISFRILNSQFRLNERCTIFLPPLCKGRCRRRRRRDCYQANRLLLNKGGLRLCPTIPQSRGGRVTAPCQIGVHKGAKDANDSQGASVVSIIQPI